MLLLKTKHEPMIMKIFRRLAPLGITRSTSVSFFVTMNVSVIGMDFYVHAKLSPSSKFKWDRTRVGVFFQLDPQQ